MITFIGVVLLVAMVLLTVILDVLDQGVTHSPDDSNDLPTEELLDHLVRRHAVQRDLEVRELKALADEEAARLRDELDREFRA